MKRLLCVWLPNWPIQRLQSLSVPNDAPGHDDAPNEQTAAPKPSAPLPLTLVWKDDPRRGRLVVACCHASAAMGVRIAMPIAQAGELIQAVNDHPPSPGKPSWIQPHDPWLDQQSLQQIATLLQQHISPLVAIETLDEHPWADLHARTGTGPQTGAGFSLRHQPESLLCEITGIAHLFDGEAGLLQAAEKLLATRRLTARMAIADSVGAAWALAHYAGQQTEHVRTIAGQAARPCGWIARPGESKPAVTSLPVESLRIAQQTVDTLHRLGIQRIDQLLDLPKSGLVTRLGKTLLRRIEQATTPSDEPLVVHRPPAQHSYRSELEYPTTDLEIIAHRIEQLIEKTRAGLATEHRGALRLTCQLDLASHPPLTFDIGLFAPTLDVGHLTGLMINQIENKRLPSHVVRINVSVTLSGPLRSNQTSLFKNELGGHGIDATSGSDLGRLVNSLSGRLGRDAVIGVRVQEDPLPENAYRVWPLTGNQRDKKKKSPATASSRSKSRPSSSEMQSRFEPSPCDTPSSSQAMRRPLSLLARPIPLIPENQWSENRASLPDPRLPDRFRLDAVVHRIIRYWGPERIETGWWKGPCVRRDYYRIETDRGSWWWIFRSIAPESQSSGGTTKSQSSGGNAKSQSSGGKRTDQWMLHGRFD